MKIPRNLPEAIVAATPSPYPASFDGSTLRYQAALFSLMCLSVVGSMILVWMAREIVQGRRDAFPHEPLFAIRAGYFCASLTAVLRSVPEAAMMITWHENVELAGHILIWKRWCDVMAFFPGMGWMALVFVFHPSICMGMVRLAREPGGPGLPPLLPRERMAKLVKVIGLLFAISILIAVGKRW